MKTRLSKSLFANRYLHRDGIPIIGINEILKSLVGVQAITQKQYYEIIQVQRASNVRFIPLQEDEILYHLRQAHVENGRLSETAELGVLRRYVAACILSRDLINIQQSSNQAHGKPGEFDFLIGLEHAIVQALVELWQDDVDDATLQARADWILSNLYLDHLGVFSAASFERSGQDSRYLAAITLAALVNHAIVLDWRSPQGTSSKRRKYFEWLSHRLLSQRFDNEPTIVATVVEILKSILESSGKELQEDGTAQIKVLLMQRLYDDLPKRLQRELFHDSDFMAKIGLTPITAITIGNLSFDIDQFYSAASAAINGQPTEVTPLRFETPIQLRSSTDPNERNVIYAENPTDHNQIRIVSDELILLRESVLERETILRQHREWFDCSQDIFERALAEIATTQEPVERIRKLKIWQQASATVYYTESERRLRHHAGANTEEFLPPDSEGLLRHFRFNENIGSEEAFRDGLESAAQKLICEEGLFAAIERMIGFPIALPECIINAVIQLDQSQKRNLLKQLLIRATSPIARIHLMRMLMLSANDMPGAARLAHRMTTALLADDEIDCFEASFALLHWVYTEFEHRAGFASWSPQVRLAMNWAHAEKLFSLFIKHNISLEWISDTFTKLNLRIPINLFGSDSAESYDITHPRYVSRVSFLLMGLAYALGANSKTVITPDIQSRCLRFAFTYHEGVRLPETSLAFDSTRANNLTSSFLGRERSQCVLPFLGEDLSKEFSSQAIEQIIEQRLMSANGEGQWGTWFLLFSTLHGLPPYASIKKPLDSICEFT
jgi:uncharacterized membrane protein YqjE